MVSKAFKTCLLLVEKMVKHNYVNQIDKAELEKLISMYIGADERTIEKYVRVCVQFGLLKPHIQKHGKISVFCINLSRVDHEMKQVFGRNLRQLELLEPES